MPTSERLEAIGPRGEACIVVRTFGETPNGHQSGHPTQPGQPSYRLATGDRLTPTEDPRVFRTLDGLREFKLR